MTGFARLWPRPCLSTPLTYGLWLDLVTLSDFLRHTRVGNFNRLQQTVMKLWSNWYQTESFSDSKTCQTDKGGSKRILSDRQTDSSSRSITCCFSETTRWKHFLFFCSLGFKANPNDFTPPGRISTSTTSTQLCNAADADDDTLLALSEGEPKRERHFDESGPTRAGKHRSFILLSLELSRLFCSIWPRPHPICTTSTTTTTTFDSILSGTSATTPSSETLRKKKQVNEERLSVWYNVRT